jgi:Putative zinc-finger
MTDCPNADIRDQLPDLLHGHLDDASRARVELHLRTCASCRQELELLRAVRRAAPEIAVDVGRIVSALPAPRRRRMWNSRVWQLAAAVVFLAAGGSAVERYVNYGRPADPIHAAVASNVDSGTGAGGGGEVELSVGYGYGDLTDEQLQALLQDVEQLTAVPMTDPEVSVPIVTVNNGGV